jgi:hypothetical protein
MKLTDITLADVSVETKVETLGVVLDKKLSEIDAQVSTVTKLVGPEGPKGAKGDKGDRGEQGIAGKDGKDGRDGKDGKDGKDGTSGVQGVSVVNASVALDGSLVLELSDGNEIDVGDVVGPAGPGGLNGPTGPQGLQGPQGEQGIQGPAGPTGATGPQGEQGIQGIQGVKGDTGDTGPTGPQGPKGDTGDTGAPGTSVNIKGEVATVGALPSSGNSIGDAYIVTADGNLYTWTGSAWLDVGQIVGPQGPTGPQGPQGIQGETGATGATGPQGIQGIQGPKGDTGDTGPTGPAGTNGVGVPVGGTAGQVLSKINATDYNTQWITPNAGTVTSVSGTAPVVSSGGTTPAISMAKATSLVDGYLSATDWTTFNSKQPAGTYATGTGTASGTNTGDETTATIKTKLGAASTSTDGYLISADWTTFNGKQATLVSGTNIKTINGTTILGSGDITITGGSGTVTSVSGTGTVSGISLSGTVTTSGNLTLGGTLSATSSNISDFSTAVDTRIGAASINALSDVVISSPSNTQVLTYNGTNWVNAAAPTGGGGGSLTSAEASLSSDVQMPTSNTWYDGPSVSLAAGTWLINTHTTLARTATTALTYFNRLTDGTNHHASSSQYQASVANHTVSIGLSAVITLASTTTIKIQSASNAGATSVLMKAALLANGSGNNATQITAVKIA